MEDIKKHWKPIAIGVTALSLAFLTYYYSRDEKQHALVQDVEQLSKKIDAQEWPSMHRIVDPTKTQAEQEAQFNKWINKVVSQFVEKHGNFKTGLDGTVGIKDFLQTYQLVEVKARMDLKDTRQNDALRKAPLFEKAFFAKTSEEEKKEDRTEAKEKYVDLLLKLIDAECDLYGNVLNDVLKITKINRYIWEYSLNKYLSTGKEYTFRACQLCMNSPFAYAGNKSREEIITIYEEAVQWATDQICGSKDKESECVHHIIQNQRTFDDQENIHQTLVIVFDFITQDYILYKYGISGTEFKSAICAFDLCHEPRF